MQLTDDFRAIQTLLTALPTVIQERVVVGGLRAGAKVIAKEAQNTVAKRTGLLQKEYQSSQSEKKYTPDDTVRFFVLPKTNLQLTSNQSIGGQSYSIRARGKVFHGHFVEFGTKKMAAQPFLYPAAQKAKSGEVITVMQNYVRDRIPRDSKVGTMIEAELYAHLKANVPLVNERVYANVLAQNAVKPAIAYSVDSQVLSKGLDGSCEDSETDFVIHIYHTEYLENKQIKDETILALFTFPKGIESVTIEDGFDTASELYVQVIKFKIKE